MHISSLFALWQGEQTSLYIRWSRTRRGAQNNETLLLYFLFFEVFDFLIFILFTVEFGLIISLRSATLVKLNSVRESSFKHPRHNCFTVRNISSKWEHLFFVPRDRQMIRLPLLTVTWSWRISNEEETGWGWQTFCGTTKGKTLTNLRTKTNNWSYLTVRGAVLSINLNRNVNFVEKKLMDVVW